MAVVWVSILWLAGIFAGRQIPFQTIHWLVLSCVCAFAALLLRRDPSQRNLFLILIIFPAAGLRAHQSIDKLDQSDLGYYNYLEV